MSISTDRTPFGSKPCNVFVSYLRGDTYGPVVSHLINYFRIAGISVLIDRVEIGPGEPMEGRIRCSIENCDIYIIFFSENYATSNSCLWELAAIVKAAAAVGKKILPVFYDVTTEDVKLKTDKYRRQLSQHSAESGGTIEEWSNALRGTPQLLGWKRPSSDADLCQGILERVQDLIRQKELSVKTLEATLRGCPNLQSVEGLGLGSASRTFITVEDCASLTSLFHPSQSRNLTEMISIRNCDKLKEVPFGQLGFLKVFNIEDCTSIERLSNVANAGKLEELNVRNCQNLREIEGLKELSGSLKLVNIHECGSLQSVESSLSKIPRDTEPNRSGGNIQSSSSEESETDNSTPTPSSIVSTCVDHDHEAEAEAEMMHQPNSSLGTSSLSALTETTQQDAEELAILNEYDRLLLLS